MSQNVRKKSIINKVAEATNNTQEFTRNVVELFLSEIIDDLSKGNRLEFRKFGVFEVRSRPGRIAQNPKTLEKVEVGPKRVVKFKVGNVLKEKVEAISPTDPPKGGDA